MPAWPEEPDGDCAPEVWIQAGKAYADGLLLWRSQLRKASESTKAVVDQLLLHLQDTDQLLGWDQLVCSLIKPEVQVSPVCAGWQACTKLIRITALTPAQLLGISLDQAETGNFESARQGLEKLIKTGPLDQTLTKNLCLKILCEAAHNLARGEKYCNKEMSSLITKHISVIRLIHEWNELARPPHTTDDSNILLKKILNETANPVILIAGMRHSASTALFNIVRIGFELSGKQISANYSEYFDINNIEKKTGVVYLTKIHEYREDHYQRADFVITSRRDLRDSVASAKRRDFGLLNNVGGAIQYAAYNRSLHEAWHTKSDYELSYEYFINNPIQAVTDILEIFGIDPALASQVAEAVKTLPTNNYNTTLLSDTHITDPKQELTFKDTLETKDITSINERNKDWLKRYSYI